MGIISWIIFGLIAGAIAKAIHPGKDPGGWIITIIIGILGSILGGWIGSSVLGWGSVSGWNFKSFILAIVGAIILLWIYGLIKRNKAS